MIIGFRNLTFAEADKVCRSGADIETTFRSCGCVYKAVKSTFTHADDDDLLDAYVTAIYETQRTYVKEKGSFTSWLRTTMSSRYKDILKIRRSRECRIADAAQHADSVSMCYCINDDETELSIKAVRLKKIIQMEIKFF